MRTRTNRRDVTRRRTLAAGGVFTAHGATARATGPACGVTIERSFLNGATRLT